LELYLQILQGKEVFMLKNIGFMVLAGALVAVFFSPIIIEAKEMVKKEYSSKKKRGGCPCGK
jgi:hypothetical protein